MQRIIVHFPDPDGPATTTTSPGQTFTVSPRRTCSLPNHLWTSSSKMIGPLLRRCVVALAPALTSVSFTLSPHSKYTSQAQDPASRLREYALPLSKSEPSLQRATRVRHAVVAHKVNKEEDDIDLPHVVEVLRHREQGPTGPDQFCQPDDHRQRRILEQADELPDQRGDHVLHRLRQHNVAHRRQPRQTEGPRRLHLSVRHRLDASPDNLADGGGGEDAHGDHRPLDPAQRA